MELETVTFWDEAPPLLPVMDEWEDSPPQEAEIEAQDAPQEEIEDEATPEPVQAESLPETVAPPERLEDIPEGLLVQQPVLIEETGETVQVVVNAREAVLETDQRIERGNALLELLRR